MKDYAVQKVRISSGKAQISLLILRPTARRKQESAPGVLWIHGGGYAVGMAGMVFISRALRLVTRYGAVVVAPEYRLAGKAPYPAALEDCYAALKCLREYARELGCSDRQLMVGGESAGGGLTAALCMLARDRGEVNIAFQMPLYPMLDDRATPSSRKNHGVSWGSRRNRAAWRLYLRGVEGDVPPYAAPARQTDYRALPPAYTFVGEREPFYCETLAYVRALQAAGVPAKADVYPSGFHAFDMLLPFRRVSRQAIRAFEAAYCQAAAHCFAEQPRLSE